MVNNVGKTSYLQYIGFGVLSLFFFMYTLGSLYGQGDVYLGIFYVAIVIAAVILIQNGKLLGQYRRYYLWQGAFIALIIFSTLYTADPHPGPHVLVMFKILLKVTTVAIICKDFEGVKKLMFCLAFVGIAVFITLYSRGLLAVTGRLGYDIMGNANSFGLMAAVFFTGAMYSFLDTKSKILRIILLVGIFLDVLLIILTGGRKFLLYAIVFVFTSLFVKGKANPTKLIVVTIITGIFVFIGAYFIMHNEFLYDAIGYRFAGLSGGEAEGVDDQDLLMRRGMELFSQKPILGWGVNGYAFSAGMSGMYAHSNYVELLTDFGIIGTLLFYSNYIWCFSVMWRSRRHKDEEFKLYFPLLISIMVIEVFSITFNQTAYIPLFIMLITGYCFRLNSKRNVK